jgi:glycosyltransferase involved in cell wall biosynthesis
VRVLSLTRGEFFEPALRALGVEPVWVGRFSNPVMRTASTIAALRDFRPHVLQSAHFYTNLYVSLAAPCYGAISIGAARGDVVRDVASNGRWGRSLLRAPSALVVNSYAAQRNAVAYGVPAEKVHVLPNVIDLTKFDAAADVEPLATSGTVPPLVVGVGTFIRAKRFDRFLHVLARARGRGVALQGLLIGDGPERGALEALAGELGLLPDGVRFAGRRTDVPALLRRAQIYLLTSDHEGFPNVLLEAMAARLPVVTTTAGDAGVVVEEGKTGFTASPDDLDTLTNRVVELVSSSTLRTQLGEGGRRRVETLYTRSGLGERLLGLYRTIAEQLGNRRTLALLPN